MHPDLIYWLWLTMAYGPANPRKWNMLSHYKSVKAAYEAISSDDLRYVMPDDRRSVASTSIEQAQKLLDYTLKKEIGICCYDDGIYPERLKDIYNPPSVLFYLGDITVIDESVVVTCVGTKKPDEYSVAVSERICHDLAKAGVVIASGFAVGLDSVAHNSAIKAGGKTVAVLPCGILCDYPKENSKAKQLIAENGAVISECLPADKAFSYYFRLRNRILSGIGLGTLVLQAGATSGALSTASFALSQGKDIFCIPPHELYNDDYSGVIGLIRDGAVPVFEARDVLNEYYSAYAHKLNPNSEIFNRRADSGLFAKQDTSKPKPAPKKSPAKSEEVSRPVEKPKLMDTQEMPQAQRLIYEYLAENGAQLLDAIFDAIGSEIPDLESELTDMEIDGIIRALPGNRFSI